MYCSNSFAAKWIRAEIKHAPLNGSLSCMQCWEVHSSYVCLDWMEMNRFKWRFAESFKGFINCLFYYFVLVIHNLEVMFCPVFTPPPPSERSVWIGVADCRLSSKWPLLRLANVVYVQQCTFLIDKQCCDLGQKCITNSTNIKQSESGRKTLVTRGGKQVKSI